MTYLLFLPVTHLNLHGLSDACLVNKISLKQVVAMETCQSVINLVPRMFKLRSRLYLLVYILVALIALSTIHLLLYFVSGDHTNDLYEYITNDLTRGILRNDQDALPESGIDHGEKYLFYMPHSGFVNQLIELANGMMIAYITKRTLILPPFYMNFLELPFNGYKELMDGLKLADILVGGFKCDDPETVDDLIKSPKDVMQRFSRQYRDISKEKNKRFIIPFDSLFDRKRIPEGIKVMSITEFLEKNPNFDYSKDVTTVKELSRFGFRYVDNIQHASKGFLVDNMHNSIHETKDYSPNAYPNDRYIEIFENETRLVQITGEPDYINKTNGLKERIHMGRYKHIVDLGQFNGRKDLVILSTTFFEDRLLLNNPLNAQYNDEVVKSLMYSNVVLDKIVSRIKGELGTYVGLHLRGSDGHFKDKFDQTLRRATDRINQYLCSDKRKYNCLKTPLKIFIASDIKPDIVKNGILSNLPEGTELHMLNDFADYLVDLEELKDNLITNGEGLSSTLLEKAFSEFNQQDTSSEQPSYETNGICENYTKPRNEAAVWIPILDQMLAANGYAFIGTIGSSYSQRIGILHKSYNAKHLVIPFV